MSSSYARKCILDRKDYVPGKPIEEVQREYGITDIIKMASNENPLGSSPYAINAMIKEVQENSNRYPVSLCTALLEKLSECYGISQDKIYIDNGGDAVITMFGLTYFNPEDEIITASITFPAYENIATKMGSKLIKVPLTAGGFFDIEAIKKAVTDKTKCIFVCSPNNPTGALTPKEDIQNLLDNVPRSVIVFLDEAYIDFADSSRAFDSLASIDKYPNLFVMRTFSKVMGLAGVRCGYVFSQPEQIKAMMKAREPFPVNRIAQVGAIAALDDEEFKQRTLVLNAAGRRYFYEELDKMGLKYLDSQSNFICVDLGVDSETVFSMMLKNGVIIRPLAGQGLPTSVRITFGLPEENRRTIETLKKVLEK